MKNRKSYWHVGYCILILLLPAIFILLPENYGSGEILMMMILSCCIYLFLYTLFEKSAWTTLILTPLLLISGYQLVLLFLFRRSVISADILLNMFTTNTGESSELVGQIWPLIAAASVVYVPPVIWAIWQLRKRVTMPQPVRLVSSIVATVVGSVLVMILAGESVHASQLDREIYPVNAIEQIWSTFEKKKHIAEYDERSAGFSYQANAVGQQPDVVILVLGETSRASSFQLYGYKGKTNRALTNREDVIVFKDVITECNTTHKIVPMILTDVSAINFQDIYSRKGVISAYQEAGYHTVCISNHVPDGGLTDALREEADQYYELKDYLGMKNHPVDLEALPLMEKLIEGRKAPLFILYHTYGSHFSYDKRYDKRSRHFVPEEIHMLSMDRRKEYKQAYDNTIVQVDMLLDGIYDLVERKDIAGGVLYLSDHGEDLGDDKRNMLLHCSPLPSYYQLHIPFIMWFSDKYEQEYPSICQIAVENSVKPASTNVAFHTLLDMGQIDSPYKKVDKSVVNSAYELPQRYYLNIYDEAVPLDQLPLHENDWQLMGRRGLRIW